MRILFLTSNDNVFLPRFYDEVFTKTDDDIVGLAIVKDPHFRKFLKESLYMMGPRLFFLEVLGQVFHKIANLVKSVIAPAKVVSLKSVAARHGIALLKIDKINDKSFRSRLEESKVDLIVSTSCPQILRNKILATPRHGCINVHYGLLPNYRGLYPSFWVLSNGEDETGVTVHYMVREVDAGEILAQIKVPINKDDSFYSLVGRLKSTIGPEALLCAVDKIKSGNPELIPNDPSIGTYYSFPRRDDMKRFLKRGRKWR